MAAAARRRPVRFLAPAALLAAAAWLVWRSLAGPGAGPAAEAREGPFRVSIVESGTLQALRSITYSSSIQSNQAKIVALAAEGAAVRRGDLLVLFDAAPFEDEIRKNQALLAQAEAELVRTREDLKLQELQNREELDAARGKVEKSDLELRDAQEGKGRVKEEEAGQAVAEAERDLRRAESQLADLRPLLAEGFITRLELERAEQQVEKAREELGLARRRRDALVGFARPLELREARAASETSREALRQMRSAGAFRSAQKQAAIAAARSRIEEARAKLDLARQQLARCEIRADVDGIVVHKLVYFGSEQRRPQVGDQVFASQPLVTLPDVSRMVVETRVRETDVHRVEKNQKVEIRVEAYPDLRLTGAVAAIGALAEEERERRGAKYFSVRVLVNESEPRLRPGMTARVEIAVEERKSALYVPIDAVFERDGRTVVFPARRSARPREVVLGPANADFVVVLKGLVRGERVLLRDPDAALPEPAGAPAP